MDRKTRRLQRRFFETNDINHHAALLRHLLIYGLLDEKRVVCAGFFGHKACRLALPEKIKKSKVIDGDRVFHKEELKDFIRNSVFWGLNTHLKVKLALIKLTSSSLIFPKIIEDLDRIAISLDSFINKENISIYVRQACLKRYHWDRELTSSSYNSRQRKLVAAMNNMCGYNVCNFDNSSIRLVSLEFKDKIFRKTIKDEVVPYLLGEWK